MPSGNHCSQAAVWASPCFMCTMALPARVPGWFERKFRNESCVPWKIEAAPTFRGTVTEAMSVSAKVSSKAQREGQGHDHMGPRAHWLPA